MEHHTKTISCILLDIRLRKKSNSSVVELIATTEQNEKCILIDTSFFDHFSILYDEQTDVSALISRLERLSITDPHEGNASVHHVSQQTTSYMGKPVDVVTVFFEGPNTKLLSEISSWNEVLHVLEHDVPLETKYLMEQKLRCPLAIRCTVTSESRDQGVVTYKLLSFEREDKSQQELVEHLRVSAFDIETYHPPNSTIDPERNPILMICHTTDELSDSRYHGLRKNVFTWHPECTTKELCDAHTEEIRNQWDAENHPDVPEVIVCSDERDMIRRFIADVHSVNPDVITGYSSDNFDMRYLLKRSRVLDMQFKLNIDNTEPSPAPSADGAVSVFGMVHIDLYKFVRRFVSSRLKTKRYSLDAVASEILGGGKVSIDMQGMYQHWDARNMKEIVTLVYYNYVDTKLTLDLYRRLQPNMIEFLSLIGNTFFTLTRLSYSKMVEYYLMQQAVDMNELIPESPDFKEIKSRRETSFQGAFVYQPTPNLYHNISVFDFRSLYPSIIISHNISPETLNADCPQESRDLITLDQKHYWFCRDRVGFIPKQLESIISLRTELKNKMKSEENDHTYQLLDARQYSLKILLNSFYGYLGFFGARWYSMGCVESVTYLGRQYIMKVIDYVKTQGLDVIYSDTDSIFVLRKEKTDDEVHQIVDSINADLPGVMELSFEAKCSSGIFVSMKGDSGGAKKKYALRKDDGELIIKGFETIRRNWCDLVKEVQLSILDEILSTGDFQKALRTVTQTIKQLKEKDIPLDKLVLSTALTKDPDDYTVVTPAVAAARLLMQKNVRIKAGSPIAYIVAEHPGASAVRDKVVLPEDADPKRYDAEYYIENQIIPAVRKILEVGGITEGQIRQDSQDQQSLSQWA